MFQDDWELNSSEIEEREIKIITSFSFKLGVVLLIIWSILYYFFTFWEFFLVFWVVVLSIWLHLKIANLK